MEKLGIFTIFLLLHTNGYLCEDNPCRHTLANTDLVDLTTLKSQQYMAYAPNNQTYVFSICQDSSTLPAQFPVDPNNCTKDGGYSLCLYNSTSQVNFTKLAKTTEWKWSESEGDHIYLTKASADSTQLRIELSCLSSSHESTFFVATPAANDSGDIVRNFHLFSPLACPKKVAHDDGLSTGSVLMIMLLVAFLTYLAIGIVVNFFLVGARGMEVIPNITFWRNLPGLVIVKTTHKLLNILFCLIAIFLSFRMARNSYRMAAK